jgi:hypothetical protein
MGKWVDVSADVMLSKLLPGERRRWTVDTLEKRVMQLSDIVAENMFESMLDFVTTHCSLIDFGMQ